ncbi:hypothetical protein D3C87_2046120 [compost metagenome]
MSFQHCFSGKLAYNFITWRTYGSVLDHFRNTLEIIFVVCVIFGHAVCIIGDVQYATSFIKERFTGFCGVHKSNINIGSINF